MKRNIIIDTDPGIDDAVAIAMAAFSDKLDLKLITTVAGNVSIDKVTKNALKLVEFFKKDIPVARGAQKPLIQPYSDAADVHGQSGMDGYEFKEPDMTKLSKNHAVEEMKNLILNSKEKITLVPIAPLTNIALLFSMYPEVKNNIEEIVMMGGSSSRGNKGIMSEFNIDTDPEAAKIVLNSGVKITMALFDVGLKAKVKRNDIEILQNMNKTGRMISSLFEHYRSGSLKDGLNVFDACAILYLLHPEIFTVKETFVDIETNYGYARGMSVMDLDGIMRKEKNASVCLDVDQEKFSKYFMDALKDCI